VRGRDRRRMRCSGCAAEIVVSFGVGFLAWHVVGCCVAGYMTHDPLEVGSYDAPKSRLRIDVGWAKM
jgi:hypothetical protein